MPNKRNARQAISPTDKFELTPRGAAELRKGYNISVNDETVLEDVAEGLTYGEISRQGYSDSIAVDIVLERALDRGYIRKV